MGSQYAAFNPGSAINNSDVDDVVHSLSSLLTTSSPEDELTSSLLVKIRYFLDARASPHPYLTKEGNVLNLIDKVSGLDIFAISSPRK